MQKNKKRKGFTLTELAIVIAVIAILIAVLVPTFTSLINKAKESSDQQTVKNLNTALTVDEAINGKPANIDEVLEVAENAGYKVENLTPASDSSLIVWNETDNQFEYVKADELSTTYTSNQSTIWLITSSYDKENADFSQYISGTITEDLTVSAGISVGSNSDINICYEDSTEESVTFVTNGGTLTLNNANATVTHYGTADTVNVEAVDENNSYHLNGEVVGNINVTKGHVVIEANAVIPTIIVTSSEVTIQINSTSVITIATTDSNLVSTLSNIVSGNKTNVTVVDQVCDSTAISYFAGGLGTETSPYLISTAQEFVNIGKLENDMFKKTAYHFSLIKDIDLNDVNLSSSTSISKYFCGTLNGNGYDLIANDDLSYIFCDAVNDTESNVTTFVDIDLLLDSKIVKLCPGYYYSYTNITFDDVCIGMADDSNYVTLTENEGVYLDWAGYSYSVDSFNFARGTYKFVNCDCSVNIRNATSYNAIYVGGGIYGTNVNIDNCSFSGEYIGQKCSLILGNAQTYSSSSDGYYGVLTISNFTNSGKVYGTTYKPVLAGASSENGLTKTGYIEIDSTTVNAGTLKFLSDTGLSLTTDSNGQYIITEGTGASNYTLTIAGGARGFFYTDGTSANRENSTYTFTLNLGNITFTNKEYATGFYTGKFATKEQYLSEVDANETFANVTWYDIVSNDGGKVCMIKHTDGETTTYYYVFDFSTSTSADTYKMQFVVQGSSTLSIVDTQTKNSNVSSYDSAGEIQGTAYGK